MSTLNVNNINEAGGVNPVIASGVLDSGSLPAGSIVASKYISKTDAFSASIAGGGSAIITGLSIDHAVSSASNYVLLFATVTGGRNGGRLSAGITADGTFVEIADTAGSRSPITVQNFTGNDAIFSTVSQVAKSTPGGTSSVTYAVYLQSNSTVTDTFHVNRAETDTDSSDYYRGVSSLMLLEVAG